MTDSNNKFGPADIDLGYFAPYLMARLSTHFQNLLLEHLDPLGLLVVDWRSLICMSRKGESRINDIADFTRIQQSTVSRSVDRLEKKGLVVRTWSEEDRRVAMIRLSDSGEKLLADLIDGLGVAVHVEMNTLLGEKSGEFIELLREALMKTGLEDLNDL